MRNLLSTLAALAWGLFVSANAFAQEASEVPAPAPTGDLTLPLQPPPPPASDVPPPPVNEMVVPPMGPQSLQLPPPALNSPYSQPSMWGTGMAAPAKIERRWYGWQTMAVLGSVDLLTVIGIGADVDSLQIFSLYAFIPAHVMAGPIVHWAHGNAGQGFMSLGLNIALPAMGILPGIFLAAEYKGEAGLLAMIGLGGLAAHAIDLAMFSFDETKMPSQAPSRRASLLPSSVAVVPMLDANKRGLALVGQF